ncbi:MAG: hypothetical protein A3G02_02320 [Candidatus Yanofskybacteria bacterium RIFCSPLOWO2_12_FULL_44_13b]|uniref:Glycine zipper domain-containing protein n=2 Tax=Candidatus Yanofskyibacteriota TaxID=1752733 RepID=A0A1F8H357_9BACT|nr:MAG: hypothetical protein UW14_C0014G0003 [Candidatus Yanofskybacteria bacterium GW2011_GWA2_44_10]KKT89957.1 MAG: hypothetical protein UW90_C0010G0004 [Candidatus Yanofskybacteria bacterium GW2011_GWB1_45_11]OGN02069.1 MAG: hypothetical protein A2657_01875 [Candidatus Yanofskybacteria bacterium RIFCSPHIGHO2_01_FULL_44_110b]OGN18520.1 MAG: hypothetical protein A3F50_02130 [Candidatus Yanofskybacteria bacterium RIFCSPHIGHO2_12_FULL_44_29b]OGN26474.1 MAG: hypothetical protein A3B12_03015 [Cand
MRQALEFGENVGKVAYESVAYYLVRFAQVTLGAFIALFVSLGIIKLGSWTGFNFISVAGVLLGMSVILFWMGVAIPLLVIVQVAAKYKPLANVLRAMAIVLVYGMCLAFYVYISHLAVVSPILLNILIFAVVIAATTTIFFQERNSFTQKPFIATAAITIFIVPPMVFMPKIVSEKIFPKASAVMSDTALEVFGVTAREVNVVVCSDGRHLCKYGPDMGNRLKLYNPNTGKNLYWYGKCDGAYRLFDNPGQNPYCPEELKPFSYDLEDDIIKELKASVIPEPEAKSKEPAPEPTVEAENIPISEKSDIAPPLFTYPEQSVTEFVSVEKGVEFSVSPAADIYSFDARVGDRIPASLAKRISLKNGKAFSANTPVVISIRENSLEKQEVVLALSLDEIGSSRLSPVIKKFETDGDSLKTGFWRGLAGAVGGAVIGGMIAGKKGAAIGIIIGGSSGILVARHSATNRKFIVIKSGSQIKFKS